MDDVLQPTAAPGWVLRHDGFDIETESAVESRFALGNGFLGMRAARAITRGPTWVSWLPYVKWSSWPRCYVAGLFDRPNTEPPIPMLVPVADWSRVRILLDGEPVRLGNGSEVRELDLRRGAVLSDIRHANVLTVRELRLVSQADRSLGVQLLRMVLDRDGIEVRLEASFAMAGLGMEPLRLEQDSGVWHAEGSGRSVAMAGRATLRLDATPLQAERPFPLRWAWRWHSVVGQVVEFDRVVTVARGDGPGDDPFAAVSQQRGIGWRAALAAHEAAWRDRWDVSDIVVEGDDDVQRSLRFAVYHLTSAANPADERVSIGARALTGDVYFGHVFWDTEIYLLPFYTTVWPEAARSLLMYRWHTLPGARAKAAHMGYRGAMYAWESADTGEETTPEHLMGPGGKMVDILTGVLEQHITADIAYAVWHYWRATRDDAFLLEAGAEILLETARFWASRAALEADGKRHIRHVIGPDEYHEDVDDNAFTNVMARWNIARGLETVALLQDRWPDRAAALCHQLNLDDRECDDWRDAVERIVTGFDPRSGLYEQFAGYHGLERIDPAAYANGPADIALGRERIKQSQVLKQADVVALTALLPEAFPGETALANFRHYEPRCAHGSSLSAGMHALVAARLGDAEMALRYLHQAAEADMREDAASAGGVRIAGLGAVWQTVILGFAGLDLSGDAIVLDPRLPPAWHALSFAVRWRGRTVRFRITDGGVSVAAPEKVPVRIGGALTVHSGVGK